MALNEFKPPPPSMYEKHEPEQRRRRLTGCEIISRILVGIVVVVIVGFGLLVGFCAITR